MKTDDLKVKILGIVGTPIKGGNCQYYLEEALKVAESVGVRGRRNFLPPEYWITAVPPVREPGTKAGAFDLGGDNTGPLIPPNARQFPIRDYGIIPLHFIS